MTDYPFNLRSKKHFSKLFEKYPSLRVNKTAVFDAVTLLIEMWRRDSFLFLCGNGGSAADCEHIAAELLKGFRLSRPLPERRKQQLSKIQRDINIKKSCEVASKLQQGLRVISLPSQISITSAVLNDTGPEYIFAQQLEALARKDDVLFAISTSGNAENVWLAAIVAKSKDMKVIALTGEEGGRLKEVSDVLINVAAGEAAETAGIQELHLPVYHTICSVVEEELFSEFEKK